MSAEININEKTKQASMISGNNITPWHGLGTVIDGLATAKQVMELGGLDYQVEKIQEQVFLPTGENGAPEIHDVPGRFAITRTDNHVILGSVGNVWTPLQNEEALSFFDPIVDKDEAAYETAGVLGEGQRAWIMAALPDHIRIGNSDDLIKPYVTIINTFDGKSSVTIMLNMTRIVCSNTMQVAMGESRHKISLPHTKNIAARVEQAHEVMGITNLYAQEMKEVFDAMAQKSVRTADTKLFLNALYPKKEGTNHTTQGDKYIEQILEAIEIGAGQDMDTTKGTVFGLYNGVTHWLDHNKEYSSNEDKLKSSWFGTAEKTRQKAFDLCLEFIK